MTSKPLSGSESRFANLFYVATYTIRSRFVTFPEQAKITGFLDPSHLTHQRRVPVPGIGTADAHPFAGEPKGGFASHATTRAHQSASPYRPPARVLTRTISPG